MTLPFKPKESPFAIILTASVSVNCSIYYSLERKCTVSTSVNKRNQQVSIQKGRENIPETSD